MKKYKIVFTGGGTAGHIFPILAICRQLKKAAKENGLSFELFYFGPIDKRSEKIFEKEGIKIKKIISGKWRRYFSFKNFLSPFQVIFGFFQAFFWLFIISPDLIFSKSGYGSIPTVFASVIFGIPIFLHESDIVAGFCSKIESKLATEVFISFPETEYFPPEKKILVGNPIREQLLKKEDPQKAKEYFEIKSNKPILLVLGGSQGAKFLNETIVEILPQILEQFELIWQTGDKNYKEIKLQAQAILGSSDLKKSLHLFPFLEEKALKNAFSLAEIAISRAGAGTLFELASAQIPAIVVPLDSSAQNHQIKNAYKLKEIGAVEVIEQENLTPNFLLEKLKFLISRKDILEKMKESLKDFSRPKSAKVIAHYLIEYLKL